MNRAEEEDAVAEYILWGSERGMNTDVRLTRSIMRDIHSKAVSSGEKRQKINPKTGPSAKYLRGFLNRHPMVVPRSVEYVDRGRINMATEETLADYFQLLKNTMVEHGIMEITESGEPIQESIKGERIYLADETGWGVSKKSRKVLGKKGQKHVYIRKSNDEFHKTLMLGVCGNGDLLPPLIILEKTFPLLGGGGS